MEIFRTVSTTALLGGTYGGVHFLRNYIRPEAVAQKGEALKAVFSKMYPDREATPQALEDLDKMITQRDFPLSNYEGLLKDQYTQLDNALVSSGQATSFEVAATENSVLVANEGIHQYDSMEIGAWAALFFGGISLIIALTQKPQNHWDN